MTMTQLFKLAVSATFSIDPQIFLNSRTLLAMSFLVDLPRFLFIFCHGDPPVQGMLDHSNRKESLLHQRGTSRTATKPPVVSKLQKSGRNESYFRLSSDISPNDVISGQKTARQVTSSGNGAGRLDEITPSKFYN